MTDSNIIRQIIYRLNQVHKRVDIKKQPHWTREFFNALAKIGIQRGFKIYSRYHAGEWLFDLCWSIEPDENSFNGLKLICECEWRKDISGIVDDFQRLTVGKADIKIMIVQYNKEDKWIAIIRECKKSVCKSLLKDGSKYILIGSGNNEDKIKVESL